MMICGDTDSIANQTINWKTAVTVCKPLTFYSALQMEDVWNPRVWKGAKAPILLAGAYTVPPEIFSVT
jgi:hypothetical protein